jgi:lysophospholipase L1-like esterase
MVTLIKYGTLSGGEKYNVNVLSLDGLSTDTKPIRTYIEYGSDGREIGRTGISNGSLYTEIDTGDTYMYDRDNATWHKVSIGGGGGGGTQGGIILVGETTTQLVDNATTNPITVDGQSYTAQPNDAVIYGNKEFLFDGTKWHEFGDLSGLASKDIGAMTGYAKASTGSAIAPTDTLNQAIGKVEKRAEVNETNILSKANTTDVNAATSNLQAQINQIITPVTQDAEVQNARVADDTTYDTLKERLDAENNYITDDLNDVETWLGYPINYFNANYWEITNSSNWGLTTTRSSVIINHKTTYIAGYPTITLNAPQGSYKFSADFSASSVKVFGLYIDGTYSKNITNGDTITVENGKVYRLTFGSSAIAEYTITDMKLVPITANGEIQKINAEIEDINTMLSDIEFDYVYKLAEITGEKYKFIMPDGSTGTAQGQTYKATDYVALNSTSIKVTCSANYGNNLYAFYDTNKTFISGYLADAGSSLTELKNQVVSVPINAKYVRLAWIESSGRAGSLEILTPIIVLDDSLAQKSLDNKKWCVIGDSLTEVNNQAPIKYYDYLSCPSTTFAYLGKGGTGFLQTYNTYENYVDRVDVLTGNEGYDVISVMGGINDSGHIGTDYQLGQLGDTQPTTIYGAIYYVFNSLITKFPLAFVFAITEPVTSYRHELGNNIDVIQQAVREVCDWLKIPVADANAKSGMRPWIEDFAAEYYVDTAHPNSKGHEKIAKSIADVFKLI